MLWLDVYSILRSYCWLLFSIYCGAITPLYFTRIIYKIESLSSGPPSAPTLSCVDLSGDMSGAVNVTVRWTLSGGDSADFYLINITTNAPQIPYGGLLNITTAIVTQYELTGFMAGYEYNITVHGSCGNQMGSESEPLTITPQGITLLKYTLYVVWSKLNQSI